MVRPSAFAVLRLMMSSNTNLHFFELHFQLGRAGIEDRHLIRREAIPENPHPGGDRHHAGGLAAAIEAERMVAEARILSPTRIRFSHLMAPSWHPA